MPSKGNSSQKRFASEYEIIGRKRPALIGGPSSERRPRGRAPKFRAVCTPPRFRATKVGDVAALGCWSASFCGSVPGELSEEVGRLRSLRCRREDRPIILLEKLDPVGDIAGMSGLQLLRDGLHRRRRPEAQEGLYDGVGRTWSRRHAEMGGTRRPGSGDQVKSRARFEIIACRALAAGERDRRAIGRVGNTAIWRHGYLAVTRSCLLRTNLGLSRVPISTRATSVASSEARRTHLAQSWAGLPKCLHCHTPGELDRGVYAASLLGRRAVGRDQLAVDAVTCELSIP
jgi:hypothetical protein